MTKNIRIEVTPNDFDLGGEVDRLVGKDHGVGASCSFVGYVRDFSERPEVTGLELEHYPGMTEKSLGNIAEEACRRWELEGITIIHRIGRLMSGDQIVLVITTSAHRAEAFAACEFIMDYLKVDAPFWKKELTSQGEHWVEARDKDSERADKWDIDRG
ncbi:molybdenum cofactor biosynthesis protein MoaE [Hahella sp. CCB-MM4]|uniref:molybdenum cofactor biosynthesis protein MoaE n=1 Tax=Hahella sp. (strain CCB-MM4) TaxID=1926491 RepID=UPI000B9A1DB5|nr:molybdenum cofactor biosynthesis protein MoaE [Hahella sp. CCB-MM4]OZG72911.1 molybdenum cofactor biosynthesis protein MoaE [Hahella sp. CCB-MM4]